MGGMIDPETGNLRSFPAGVPTLTAEQRRMAETRDGEADGLLIALDSGKRYFTAYQLKTKRDGLDELANAGIITKHKSEQHDGHYYRSTYLTRPWCLTALALRAERVRALAERTRQGPQ
jgi:hypothetical protein